MLKKVIIVSVILLILFFAIMGIKKWMNNKDTANGGNPPDTSGTGDGSVVTVSINTEDNTKILSNGDIVPLTNSEVEIIKMYMAKGSTEDELAV